MPSPELSPFVHHRPRETVQFLLEVVELRLDLGQYGVHIVVGQKDTVNQSQIFFESKKRDEDNDTDKDLRVVKGRGAGDCELKGRKC